MTKQGNIFISDTIEREKTNEYIKKANPDSWPIFPMFIVKRGTALKTIEYGIILAFGNRCTVYFGNIFNTGKDPIEKVFSLMKMKKLSDFFNIPKKEYETIDNLLDDGWRKTI